MMTKKMFYEIVLLVALAYSGYMFFTFSTDFWFFAIILCLGMLYRGA